MLLGRMNSSSLLRLLSESESSANDRIGVFNILSGRASAVEGELSHRLVGGAAVQTGEVLVEEGGLLLLRLWRLRLLRLRVSWWKALRCVLALSETMVRPLIFEKRLSIRVGDYVGARL